MDDFRTSGEHTKELFFTCRMKILHPSLKITYSIALVLGLISLLHALRYGYSITLFLSICLIILPLRVPLHIWRSAAMTLRRSAEAGISSKVSSSFPDDGMHVNATGREETILPYNTIRQVYATKKYLIVLTHARQFAVVFRDQLSYERQAALLKHLAEKGIKIPSRIVPKS